MYRRLLDRPRRTPPTPPHPKPGPIASLTHIKYIQYDLFNVVALQQDATSPLVISLPVRNGGRDFIHRTKKSKLFKQYTNCCCYVAGGGRGWLVQGDLGLYGDTYVPTAAVHFQGLSSRYTFCGINTVLPWGHPNSSSLLSPCPFSHGVQWNVHLDVSQKWVERYYFTNCM